MRDALLRSDERVFRTMQRIVGKAVSEGLTPPAAAATGRVNPSLQQLIPLLVSVSI
jgi:hypothetical protein